MTPIKVIYEIRYDDDSGDKHRVEYDSSAGENGRISITGSSDDIWIDPKDLDWLIEALQEIHSTIRKATTERDSE